MKDIVEFVGSYPLWVRIAMLVLALVFAVLALFFRGAPATGASERPTSLGLGNVVFIDISHGQDQWNDLTAWAHKNGLQILKRLSDWPATPELAPGVLVMPLPYKRLFEDSEVALFKDWVERGGGLLILGYYAADAHHGSNPSRLTRAWGVAFNEDLLMPAGATEADTRLHVFRADERLAARLTAGADAAKPLFEGVSEVVAESAASLDTDHVTSTLEAVLDSDAPEIWTPTGPRNPEGMLPIIERWVKQPQRRARAFAAFRSGRGKVALCGTWKIATRDGWGDNARFVAQLITWLKPAAR